MKNVIAVVACFFLSVTMNSHISNYNAQNISEYFFSFFWLEFGWLKIKCGFEWIYNGKYTELEEVCIRENHEKNDATQECTAFTDTVVQLKKKKITKTIQPTDTTKTISCLTVYSIEINILYI